MHGRRHSLLYVLYLRSPLWRVRRRIWIVRARGRCELCGRRRRLTIHHRSYERFGHERRSDIAVLCWPCHRLVQRPSPLQRRRRWPTRYPRFARLGDPRHGARNTVRLVSLLLFALIAYQVATRSRSLGPTEITAARKQLDCSEADLAHLAPLPCGLPVGFAPPRFCAAGGHGRFKVAGSLPLTPRARFHSAVRAALPGLVQPPDPTKEGP